MAYRFMPVSEELTLREVFVKLAALGIAGETTTTLNEADASFEKP